MIRLILSRSENDRPSSAEMRAHPFFDGIDWDKVLACEVKPPLMPPDCTPSVAQNVVRRELSRSTAETAVVV